LARSRASAKQAGSRFEREQADYLQANVSRFIDRKVRTGALDQGDIANVETSVGWQIAVECKNYGGQIKAAEWVAEAHAERDNSGAAAGIVIAKRRGTTAPGAQWVLMTVDDLVVLLRDWGP
jgi:hypothetical protein